MNKKAIIIVLDSVGIGELPDAANYGDKGADTLGHIINTCHPNLPHMMELGLANIDGAGFSGAVDAPKGCYGKLREVSAGKDTTTGHWEIAGIQLAHAFPTFPNGFPQDFIEKFEQAVGRGTLGNKPASGTAILDELGEEHLKTGKLIVYTSADSVFQIAANEAIVPLEELYRDCRIAREMLTGELEVGRVIARPFVGDHAGAFKRTGARRDFSAQPPDDDVRPFWPKTARRSTAWARSRISLIIAASRRATTRRATRPACRRRLKRWTRILTACCSSIWWILTWFTAIAAT